jgi:deoxycytidine triphosphate deaminase/intein/homing endonuclease
MILSDRTIREEIAAGRIVIEPFDDGCVQPSSVDLHIDRYFRVFRNHTMGFIDVKQDQQELTELVEIDADDVFILHPGEFVLGSTLERVALPDDLVARLEGKSSLGRLGLLIHSSLPGSEPVLFLDDTGLRLRPIEEIVRKKLEGAVVGFDPDTFATDYFPVTGWVESGVDRVFEVTLASGRSLRVTAGHNLFTLDRNGDIAKLRVQQLTAGTMVAIPRRLPDPREARAVFDLRALIPEALVGSMVFEGPTVEAALEQNETATLLQHARSSRSNASWYKQERKLPGDVARVSRNVWPNLGNLDRVRPRGSRYGLPVVWQVDEDLAWLIGLYVAEGYRRSNQVVFSNTNQRLLDRVESILGMWDLPRWRANGSITCSSSMLSYFMDWIGAGGKAWTKRVPACALGWPQPLLESLFKGLLDGDGTHDGSDRRCYWSSSPGLVSDVLYLAERLGMRAAASFRKRAVHGLFQISLPRNEHQLLTTVPLPDRLLVAARTRAGLMQAEAARLMGTRPNALSNIENRTDRDAVRLAKLRSFAAFYERILPGAEDTAKIARLVEGDVAWDRVVGVADTGTVEAVYDLEVRPGGRKVENFVAGLGGVFAANTAGFVDAGWDGHLTLELSNVANLPITLYPGMKIGQISFLKMTSEADHPYGSAKVNSKYQHQRGPTPSRYFENFE